MFRFSSLDSGTEPIVSSVLFLESSITHAVIILLLHVALDRSDLDHDVTLSYPYHRKIKNLSNQYEEE